MRREMTLNATSETVSRMPVEYTPNLGGAGLQPAFSLPGVLPPADRLPGSSWLAQLASGRAQAIESRHRHRQAGFQIDIHARFSDHAIHPADDMGDGEG